MGKLTGFMDYKREDAAAFSVEELDALFFHYVYLALDFCFSSFMFGMPYISRPPTLSSRSKTVTL